MISRIILDKKLLAQFRKQAIAAYPREHLVSVWGRLAGDTVVVSSFRPVEHTATTERLDYHIADAVVPRGGETEHFLGSCHSHPGSDVDVAPSATDWRMAYNCGEIICGIMTVVPNAKGKYKTETEWWQPRPAIVMVHPRIRQEKKPDAPAPVVEVVVEQSS